MRDNAFVQSDLAAQTTMGHIVVIPWVAFWRLPGLWISHLGLITQEGLRPRLI